MSDITKRLRLAQINHDDLHFGWLAEASDEIAALRQRVDLLKADRDKWKACCNEPYDESVLAENIALQQRVAEMKAENEALQQQVAELDDIIERVKSLPELAIAAPEWDGGGYAVSPAEGYESQTFVSWDALQGALEQTDE